MNTLSEELKEKYLKSSASYLNIAFLDACSKGDSESVSWILANEILNNKLNSYQTHHCFQAACFNGHLDVIKELDKNNKIRFDLNEGIACAIENEHENVIQYLFDSRKNILHPLVKIAFTDGNSKIIKRVFNDPSVIQLNQNNPRLNEGIIMIDQFGFELKKIAAEAFSDNNLELVKFFLNDESIPSVALNTINLNALINSKNNFKSANRDHFEQIKPEMYFYILQYCEEKNIEIYQKLLTKMFFKACEENYLPMVKYLLLHPDPDKRVNINADEDTGLLKACHNGHIEMVKYLLTSSELTKHANICAQDNSPLLYAAQEGHLKLVEYLTTSPELTSHANIYAQDEYALCLAFKGDHKEIVQFFLESPKLKTHLDIFKNFNELKEQHLSNVNDDLTEQHYHYDMRALTYLVYEYEPFTSNDKFSVDIEEMLESNPELKLAYRVIQVYKDLNQKSVDNISYPKKLKI
jgi:NADPH-dependent 7-cyano-7-deazaguanine reductase QueF